MRSCVELLQRFDAATLFYAAQAGGLFVLWAGVRIGGRGLDFYRFPVENPVALRPSWLPRECFQVILRRSVYIPIAYSVTPLLGLAAFLPRVRTVRIVVALATSIFHLAETSRTTSHWGYLMLYTLWALALLPSDVSQAAALGLTVYFMSASGVAKLFVAGLRWVDLRSVLCTFGAKPPQDGGPISATLNRLVVASKSLATASGSMTLFFECVAAPVAFFVPAPYRLAFAVAMLLLHVGIALLHSAAIGIFFVFPNMACYLFGMAATDAVGSRGWWVAVALWVTITGSVCLRRRLVPEDWPLSAMALFPWSGAQWNILHERLVQGETRLVLATEGTAPAGLPVVEINYRTARGEPPPPCPRVYDLWSRLLGITTLQTSLLDALDFEEMASPGWNAERFTQRVEEWLQGGRLIEAQSGLPLSTAFFVSVRHSDIANCSNSRAHGWVEEVLCTGSVPERQRLLG